MEAPKKIWLEIEDYNEAMLCLLQMKFTRATQYIRADLVDSLVEALEEIEHSDELASNIARAALRALEEE